MLMVSFENRFVKMADHFVYELERISDGRDALFEAVAKSVKYITIPLYPMDAFEEGANLLAVCAKFFKKSDSLRVRTAFAQAVIDLTISVAEVCGCHMSMFSAFSRREPRLK